MMKVEEIIEIAERLKTAQAEYDLIKGAMSQAQSKHEIEIEVHGYRFRCDLGRCIRLAKFLENELDLIEKAQRTLVNRVESWEQVRPKE